MTEVTPIDPSVFDELPWLAADGPEDEGDDGCGCCGTFDQYSRKHVVHAYIHHDLHQAAMDLWPGYLHISDPSWKSPKHGDCECAGLVQIVGDHALQLETVCKVWHDRRADLMAAPRWRAAALLGMAIGRDAYRILGARLIEGHPQPTSVGVSGRHKKVHQLAASQGWACLYCGVGLIDICLDDDMISDEYGKRLVDPASMKRLPTLDHLVPQSYGGSHRLENLALACQPCNSRKLNG